MPVPRSRLPLIVEGPHSAPRGPGMLSRLSALAIERGDCPAEKSLKMRSTIAVAPPETACVGLADFHHVAEPLVWHVLIPRMDLHNIFYVVPDAVKFLHRKAAAENRIAWRINVRDWSTAGLTPPYLHGNSWLARPGQRSPVRSRSYG